MKKAKMLLVAALVFGVILTSYSVSGTYAKYVGKLGGVTDSARVAKWGISNDGAVATTVELFKDSYDYADGNGEKIVAPGTTGTYKFKIEPQGGNASAAPEVNYKIVISADGEDNTNGQIKYTLGDKGNLNFENLKTEIANLAKVEGADKVFAANTSLSEALSTLGLDSASGKDLKWDWAFASDETTDTNLGNQAVNNGPVNVSLTITITVEQVQAEAN